MTSSSIITAYTGTNRDQVQIVYNNTHTIDSEGNTQGWFSPSTELRIELQSTTYNKTYKTLDDRLEDIGAQADNNNSSGLSSRIAALTGSYNSLNTSVNTMNTTTIPYIPSVASVSMTMATNNTNQINWINGIIGQGGSGSGTTTQTNTNLIVFDHVV